MAKSALLFLVLVHVFVALAMASEMSPSPSPSTVDKSSPLNRKLVLHGQQVEDGAHNVWDPSPSPSPHRERGDYLTGEGGSDHTSGEPTSIELMTNGDVLNLRTKELHLKKQHNSEDKSVAGGAVILGTLAMVFLVAIFCYIRATGRQKQDPMSTAAWKWTTIFHLSAIHVCIWRFGDITSDQTFQYCKQNRRK